ncbi:MAG: hypothetical protein HYT76_03520 [Deltaproteobacteria bacterium]|nr:hypothetical protein [Deltaproteobacteria bacterium]
MAGSEKIGGNGTNGGIKLPADSQTTAPSRSPEQKKPNDPSGEAPHYQASSRRLSKRLGDVRTNLGGGLFGHPIATIQELKQAAASSDYFTFEIGQEIIWEKDGQMGVIGTIKEISTERICVVDQRGRERWVTAEDLSNELIEGQGIGMQLARSNHEYGNSQWIEIKPKKPLPARSTDEIKALAPIANELKELLAPHTRTGMIDLTRIPAKNFEEFVRYLQTHSEINDGMSFSLPYRDLLGNWEYQPLLELIYEQAHPERQSSLRDPDEARELLKRFTANLIAIDADRFVQNHIGTPEGRSRIFKILEDKKHFNLKLRAAICKAVPAAAKAEVGDSGVYEIDKNFGFVDQYLDYGNWLTTEEQIAPAKDGILHLFQEMNRLEQNKAEDRGRYQEHPEEVTGGDHEAIEYREVKVGDTKKIVQIVEETKDQRDPVSQLKNKLAHLWLFAADARNWNDGSVDTDWKKIQAARHHLLRGVEEILPELDRVQNDQDLKRINDAIQSLLKRPLNFDNSPIQSGAKHLVSGNSITTYLEKMRSHVRQPLDQLSQYSDKMNAAYEMGESVFFEKKDLRVDEPLQEGVGQLIDALQQTKLELWQGYQQHKALSRAGSQVRNWWSGEGNITDIQKATSEIDQLIYKLQNAYETEHVEETVKELYEKLKEGGVLYEALIAAEMDGAENLIGLVQTTLEIVIPSLVTGGATALARLGIAGARVKRAVDAANVVNDARKIGAGTRALRGFGIGAYSSTADNLLELGTGGYREGNETLAKFVKDALATGSAMAVTALARIPKSNHRNIVMRLYQRFSSEGFSGFAHTFAADAGMEAVEEILDQYVRRTLDGNFSAMTWGEVTEIARICFVGSVPGAIKTGAVAELAGGGRIQQTPSPKQPIDPNANGDVRQRGQIVQQANSAGGEVEAKEIQTEDASPTTLPRPPIELTDEETRALRDAGHLDDPLDLRSDRQVQDLLENILRKLIQIRGARRSLLPEAMANRLVQRLISHLDGNIPQTILNLLYYRGLTPEGNPWNRQGTVQAEPGRNLSHYRIRREGWNGDQHFNEAIEPETDAVLIGRDPSDGPQSPLASQQAKIFLDSEGRLHIQDLSQDEEANKAIDSQDPILGFGTYRLARRELELGRGTFKGRPIITSVWVEVDPNEPLEVGDVIRLGLDGPVFTLSLEAKPPSEIDLSGPEAVGNIQIGPFTVNEWSRRFEQYYQDRMADDSSLTENGIRNASDFLATDPAEMNQRSRIPRGWVPYFMQVWVGFRNRIARELGIPSGQPSLQLLQQIYAFHRLREIQTRLERGEPISQNDIARLDRFRQQGIPIPALRLPTQDNPHNNPASTRQTLRGIGPVLPIVPLSILAGPILHSLQHFFANAVDALMYAANSGALSFPAFPTRMDGDGRHHDWTERASPLPDTVTQRLTRPFTGRNLQATWNEQDLKRGRRFEDAALVDLARLGQTRLNELANPREGFTEEAVQLRRLLQTLERTNAPSLAWIWIRALAAMTHPNDKKLTREEIEERTRIFHRVVQQTAQLYAQAERQGISLRGIVIETVATATPEVVEWLDERATRWRNGFHDGSPLAKLRGSEAELAVLKALLGNDWKEGATVEMLSRSATGSQSTPDIRISYPNGGARDHVEFWDVKTRAYGDHGIDQRQFTSSSDRARQFRSILIGGRPPRETVRSINGVPHQARHFRFLPTTVDLQRVGALPR